MSIEKSGALLLLLTMVGCASWVVKEEDLVKKTAFALNMESGDFKISERSDSGSQTNYVATTKTGKKFNCYVTGSVSAGTGRVISDAICNEIGKSSGGSCNPLLKKAGKC